MGKACALEQNLECALYGATAVADFGILFAYLIEETPGADMCLDITWANKLESQLAMDSAVTVKPSVVLHLIDYLLRG